MECPSNAVIRVETAGREHQEMLTLTHASKNRWLKVEGVRGSAQACGQVRCRKIMSTLGSSGSSGLRTLW